jgi:hypothetical protein
MIEQNALGKGVDISDNEIEQLLKLNGGDRQWNSCPLRTMERKRFLQSRECLFSRR